MTTAPGPTAGGATNRPMPLRVAAIGASAVLGVLAFPPVHWSPLALVGWIPLLWGLSGAGPAVGMALGLLHGLALFAGTLVWLFDIFGPFAIALHVIMASFGALFGLAWGALERAPRLARAFAPAAALLWVGIEHLRGEWFVLRFSWITPGTGLPPNALTPWVGTYGVSLVIILAAALLVGRVGRASLRTRLVGVGLLLGLAAATWWPRAEPAPLERPLRVAAIQGEVMTFTEYLAATRAAPGPFDAIVWPEYALGFDLRTRPSMMAQIQALLVETGAQVIVVGSRTDPPDGPWSNTALIVGRDGVLGSHDKNRPVHFFDDGRAGTESRSWPTPIGRVASPICFDNDYSPVPRAAVTHGAELLLVPSMDAKHWTARQHAQHAEHFRHRAAENGRWVVVAASSGVTQIIDPTGQRRAALTGFDPGVLVGNVEARAEMTPFTRGGWLVGPASTVGAIVLLVGLLGATIRTRRRSSA